MEQKRAREQPERYTGEDTVRGPREERLGSTVRLWHVVGAALGFSFASQLGPSEVAVLIIGWKIELKYLLFHANHADAQQLQQPLLVTAGANQAA